MLYLVVLQLQLNGRNSGEGTSQTCPRDKQGSIGVLLHKLFEGVIQTGRHRQVTEVKARMDVAVATLRVGNFLEVEVLSPIDSVLCSPEDGNDAIKGFDIGHETDDVGDVVVDVLEANRSLECLAEGAVPMF